MALNKKKENFEGKGLPGYLPRSSFRIVQAVFVLTSCASCLGIVVLDPVFGLTQISCREPC